MIDGMIGKHGKRKLFFIILFLILLIVMIIAGVKEYHAMRFTIGDQEFKYERTENRITYFMDDEGQPLIAFSEEFGTSLASSDQNVVIKYKNQTIKKAIDHESENPIKLYLDEALIDGKDSVAYYNELMNQVIEKSIYFQNGLLTYKVFISILFSLIISVSIVYPESLWWFQHMLSVKNGEPTEFYILTMRIAGVVLIFLLIRIAFL